jgi:hypothetical protein
MQIATLPLGDVMARDAFLWLWLPTAFLVVGASPGSAELGLQVYCARVCVGQAPARV